MLSCFQFHLYAGVRAGGGIGDELDPPGDEDFYWRFAFDITFFFFIIVIMLAIIQVNDLQDHDDSLQRSFSLSPTIYTTILTYENVLI